MAELTTEANKRIAKNTIFLYIRLVFVLLISLYTSRVVLYNLGIVDYGIYNVVAGFVSMFAILNTSLTNSSQRFYNYEKGRTGLEGMQKVFITAHYIQVIIALLILLLAETVGLWYVANKMVYPVERASAVMVVYQSSVIALLFVVMQIPYSAAIIAHERINYYAVVGVIDVILKLVIAFILPVIPADNLILYGILVTGVAVIDFFLYFIYAKINFKYLKLKIIFYRETFISMFRFSGWSAFNGISQTVKNQGLNILMNFFFGPVINAARGISYQIKGALLGFVMNITTAAQPQVVESYAIGNRERATKLMVTISKLVVLSLYIVALPIMVEVNFVLHLWLGQTIPDYTGIFTVLILVITMIDIMQTPIQMVIYASGKVARFNFWNSILGIAVLPIAYLFLRKGASPVSVYIISLVVSIIMQSVSIFLMRKETGISINLYLKRIILPLLVVILFTVWIPLILLFTMEEGWLRFVIVVVASVLSVAMLAFKVGLDATEKDFVLSFVKKGLKKIVNR